MSFISVGFIVFLSASVLLYYTVPKRAQWIVLLAASYLFYISGGMHLVWFLLLTTLTTYGAGLLLSRLNRQLRALSPEEKPILQGKLAGRKKGVILGALLINFGQLYILKYWSLTYNTAQAIGTLFTQHTAVPMPDLLLPLGISFYTFQSIGYVIDCYRDQYEAERNPAKFALFVSFFPQIIQGPISRFDQLAGQLTAQRRFDADNLKYGIQLILWGYFKKMIIADRAAVLVNTVVGSYTEYSGSIIALSMLFHCFELYCDFSGGIDITRGVATLFGIDLIKNFRQPVFSISLADYWRRWHISLGQWMRDYLFYPLSLSKLGAGLRKKFSKKLGRIMPTALATFVVYLAIGIWHGATFGYVALGLWNATIITASLFLTKSFAKWRKALHISEEGRWWHLFQIVRTWLLVFVQRYITRAPRFMATLAMLWTTVTQFHGADLWNGTVLTLGLTAFDLTLVLVGMCVLLFVEYHQEKGLCIRAWLEKRHWLLQWAVLMLALLSLLLFGILRGSYISSEFIYQQF